MRKSCSRRSFTSRKMRSLTDGGMSAIEMWQESAWVSEPILHTCRSCTSLTPPTARIADSIFSSFMPRGVPSSKMFSVSRTMPNPDHKISDANAERQRGINPVISRDQNGPASGDHGGGRKRVPTSCSSALRMLTSPPEPLWSDRAAARSRRSSPRPRPATHIITLACTCSGCCSRRKAS